MRRAWISLLAVLACAFPAQAASAVVANPGHEKLGARHERSGGESSGGGAITRNFRLLGHHDLGMADVNGDVWVHNDFAYVGTWAIPCDGTGVRIVDVSDLRNPELVATVPGRDGTDSEDVVVRRVSTPSFSGDLLAVGIQRCDFQDPALDEQEFGFELWNVTDPSDPEKLGEFAVAMGDGGVHELDLFQRGDKVYALLAQPLRRVAPGDAGSGTRAQGSTPLWLEPGHRVAARVVMAANQGSVASDYPAGTAGKIAVVYTPFPFFDASGDEPHTGMWGVYVRADGVIFGSDSGSGLWIVKPRGKARF